MKTIDAKTIDAFYRRICPAYSERPPTQEELYDEIRFIAPRIVSDRTLDESEVRLIADYYEANASIRQPEGFSVETQQTKHRDWYRPCDKERIGYWDRFKDWMTLESKLTPDVFQRLDNNSTAIVSKLGDPNGGPFNVRGLVLGDVQSGKTLNYSALINKAIDAGYRVIIILSGILESLRKQTQVRIEESVLGFETIDDTKAHAVAGGGKIGCGKYKNRNELIPCISGTNRGYDFSKRVASTDFRKNLVNIFVTKKNSAILKQLFNQIKSAAAYTPRVGIQDIPLLLIDDEADNASINVKKDDSEPTAINRHIRSILGAFTQSAYVGFTATPYANIFIRPNPDVDSPQKDDLFPKDFIYVIPPPSNYVGAARIFKTCGNLRSMLKDLNDIQTFLPVEHKGDVAIPTELPASLQRAIRTFILVSAIRDCRSVHTPMNPHRTMLINVSRFISVQSAVADRVSLFLTKRVRNPLISNSENPFADEVPDIQRLKAIFDEEFADGCGYKWKSIFEQAAKYIEKVEVVVCNSKTRPPLSYSGEEPRRLIVVGGLAVSRGLTLEGLSTTYLSRNTKMYDALLQMGRWFGYRPGYEDLCHLWLSDNAKSWYQYVTTAHLELLDDLRRMERQGRTPADFGLRIRQDSVTLRITALNKMRHSWTINGKMSVLGTVMQFPLLDRSPKINRQNAEAVQMLLSSLSGKATIQKVPPAQCYKSTDVAAVLQFLRKYKIAKDTSIRDEYKCVCNIIQNLAAHDSRYTRWTVAVVTVQHKGEGECYTIRQAQPREDFICISGKSRNISGGRSMGLIGLSEDEIHRLRSEGFKNERTCYGRGINREPTLIIYPMRLREPTADKRDTWTEEEREFYFHNKSTVYGITLGFPDYESTPLESSEMPYKYRINAVAKAELDDTLTDDADEYEDIQEDF